MRYANNYYYRNYDRDDRKEIATGYFLTQAEIDSLPKEEQDARAKFMLESREYIKRLKQLD